jgi:hypothetical protein
MIRVPYDQTEYRMKAAAPDFVGIRRPAPHEPVLPPLPRGWIPGKRGAANGDAAGADFTLFLSAFGFFFSRLLLNWPFATSLSRG